MFGRDLVLLNNRGVRIIDTFCLKGSTKFVRFYKQFELTNFELSDGFCLNLIVNAHGTKKFFRSIPVSQLIHLFLAFYNTTIPLALLS